jgi:Protein of unknown function (DUF2934)
MKLVGNFAQHRVMVRCFMVQSGQGRVQQTSNSDAQHCNTSLGIITSVYYGVVWRTVRQRAVLEVIMSKHQTEVSPVSNPGSLELTEDIFRQRAYELYEQRGFEPGHGLTTGSRQKQK